MVSLIGKYITSLLISYPSLAILVNELNEVSLVQWFSCKSIPWLIEWGSIINIPLMNTFMCHFQSQIVFNLIKHHRSSAWRIYLIKPIFNAHLLSSDLAHKLLGCILWLFFLFVAFWSVINVFMLKFNCFCSWNKKADCDIFEHFIFNQKNYKN